jgi:hypothetical protein
MALVNPNIAMSFRQPEFQAPNALAQYAQLAQIKNLQRDEQLNQLRMDEMQMKIANMRQDEADLERIRQAIVKNGGPSDTLEIARAYASSRDPQNRQLGLTMMQKLQDREAFQRTYGSMFPGLFPAPAAAPAAAPAVPEPSGAIVGGPIAPPTARIASAPISPPGAPASANAMAPTGSLEAMPLNQLRATQMALGASTDPRAKTLNTIIEKEIENRKQPEAVRSYEYAKTPAGGSFKGTFEDWKRLGAAQQKVVLPAQETEWEKAVGKGQADKLFASQTAAEDAASILTTNNEARALLDKGMITGAGAEFLVSLNQGLKQLGMDFGYAEASANAQAYGAVLGNNVGRMIKQFGAGTGLSDADREYAAKIAAGTIKMDEKALRKILDINDKMARNVINAHNKKYKGVKTNIPVTVEMPAAAPSPAAPSLASQIPGQTPAPVAAQPPIYATNGKQRIVSTDGGQTWKPAE